VISAQYYKNLNLNLTRDIVPVCASPRAAGHGGQSAGRGKNGAEFIAEAKQKPASSPPWSATAIRRTWAGSCS
jgi:hypothetical protein